MSRSVNADPIETRVTLPHNQGQFIYEFSNPTIYDPVAAAGIAPAGDLTDEDVTNIGLILNYQTLEITSPLGTEVYQFNVEAGMALSEATDLSGNSTRFYYSPQEVPAELGLTGLPANIALNGATYDDPIVEVDALGGTKTFT